MSKKIAFLFPGQGSQTVGMLDAFKSDSQFSELYSHLAASANSALGEDLATLVSQGPSETLNMTTNTQPAMLLADVMCFQAWLHLGGERPSMMAGHSLGEYAALVAAGVFNIHDGVKAVRARANAMQNAVPVGQGGMAAILGLSDEQVIEACTKAAMTGEVAEAVNFNAPSQVVIAGSSKGVELACQFAKELGAKRALPLPVSAPFHSSLMRPAALELSKVLESMQFQAPTSRVYNNIDVAVESEASRIKDALVRQAYGPVRWVESIQKMAAEGAELFVECGAGKVLSGMVKRIVDVPVVSISDPESARSVFASLAS